MDREISEIWDAGEGVMYAGSTFRGNSLRTCTLFSAGTTGLIGRSIGGSGDGVTEAIILVGNALTSVSGSGVIALLRFSAFDPLMMFSTSSSSLS